MTTSVDHLLFGGAFDPPHLGHVSVADQVLANNVCDQLWLMPVGTHPFDKDMAPADHRLKMVRLSFADLFQKWQQRLLLNTYELDHPEIAYSYQTLKHFQAQQPTKSFAWLIGSDNVVHFKKWRHSQELLQEFKVFVYPRASHEVEAAELPSGMELLENVTLQRVSSRQIRQRLQLGQEITDLVVPPVVDYIDHNLSSQYQLNKLAND